MLIPCVELYTTNWNKVHQRGQFGLTTVMDHASASELMSSPTLPPPLNFVTPLVIYHPFP